MTHGSAKVPLRLATEKVAAEMLTLEHSLERIEHTVDKILCGSAQKLDQEALTALQEIDLIRQTINALSKFLDKLSNDADTAGLVHTSEALETVPLRDLAARLAGTSSPTSDRSSPELF